MATVIFKRTDDQNTVPVVDGQLVFDETNYKIYMDNGNTRHQYGGDTDIISNPASATATNVFSATASTNLFLQKTTVVDTKSNALAVTQNYIPLGCLAFKETIGTTNYSGVGSTISEGLVSLKSTSNLHTNQLSANSNNIYMDYHNGKYGINTSANRGADTFIPFKNVADIITNLPSSLRTGCSHGDGFAYGDAYMSIRAQFNGSVSVSSGAVKKNNGSESTHVSFVEGDTLTFHILTSVSSGQSGSASMNITWTAL